MSMKKYCEFELSLGLEDLLRAVLSLDNMKHKLLKSILCFPCPSILHPKKVLSLRKKF